jgi:hypothetical protein
MAFFRVIYKGSNYMNLDLAAKVVGRGVLGLTKLCMDDTHPLEAVTALGSTLFKSYPDIEDNLKGAEAVEQNLDEQIADLVDYTGKEKIDCKTFHHLKYVMEFEGKRWVRASYLPMATNKKGLEGLAKMKLFGAYYIPLGVYSKSVENPVVILEA